MASFSNVDRMVKALPSDGRACYVYYIGAQGGKGVVSVRNKKAETLAVAPGTAEDADRVASLLRDIEGRRVVLKHGAPGAAVIVSIRSKGGDFRPDVRAERAAAKAEVAKLAGAAPAADDKPSKADRKAQKLERKAARARKMESQEGGPLPSDLTPPSEGAAAPADVTAAPADGSNS